MSKLKKILSFALALALSASMVGIMPIKVFAADTSVSTFAQLDAAVKNPSINVITITDYFSLEAADQLVINRPVTIQSDSRPIEAAATSTNYLIVIESGGALTLKGSGLGISITGTNVTSGSRQIQRPCIMVESGGTLTLGAGSTIIQGDNVTNGAGIYAYGTNAKVIMEPGSAVVDCFATENGAGIYIANGASLEMRGNVNCAYSLAAAPNDVYIASGGALTLGGGTSAQDDTVRFKRLHGAYPINITLESDFYAGSISFDSGTAPTITPLTLNEGPTAGGTDITIAGSGFVADQTYVKIGGKPATDVTVSSATELTCKTPAGTAGAADVQVQTDGGATLLVDGFTYSNYTIAVSASGLETLTFGQAVSGAKVIYTAGVEYAAEGTLNLSDFTVANLPAGLSPGTPVRASDKVVEIPITGTPTVVGTSTALTFAASIPATNVVDAATAIIPTGSYTPGNVEKATAITNLPDQTASHKNTVTGEQTISVAGLMPPDAGTLSYAKGTATGDTGIVNSWDVNASGLVSYTLSGTGAPNNTATLPVKITTTNYADSTVNVVITLTDQDIPTVNANNITVTYTGTALTDAAISGTATFNGGNIAGTWSFVGAPDLTNANTGIPVNVKFTPDSLDYVAVEATITVTINKANSTGTPTYTAITTSGKTLADAALGVGSIAPAGTIVWDLGDSQTVSANTAYNWTYTPTDAANYNNLTGSITPYVVSSPPSGGTGGGSTTPPAQTIPAADGEVAINITQKDETVTLDLPTAKVEEIIKAADGGAATFDISGVKDSSEAVIPQAALKALSEAGLEVEIKLPQGSVTLDSGTLATAVASGGNVTVALTQVKPEALTSAQQEQIKPGDVVIDISLMAGTTVIHELNGTATITVPYDGELPVAVWYLNDAGELEKLECSYSNGFVTFTTDHLSLYVLGQDTAWQNPFTDVAESDWFYGAVQFAHENGLFAGTSETTFSPNMSMTRAMLVTVLWRLEGEPEADPIYAAHMMDVVQGAYYEDAMGWAAENNIISGYGEGLYGPSDPITREQLATILYRYVQHKGGGFEGAWMFLLEFEDREAVSEWAYEAVCWCTMNGIINGKPGNILDPKGTATRAEVATVLRNLA